MAKTIYFGAGKKDTLEKVISRHVKKSFDESDTGKEIQTLKDQLVKQLRQEMVKLHPEEKMAVLREYDHTVTLEEVNLVVQVNNKTKEKTVLKKPYYMAGGYVTIVFDPQIEIPRYTAYGEECHYIREAIMENDDLFDQLFAISKFTCDLESDANKIVKAYRERIVGHRTVNSILKKFPDMKKFTDQLENTAEAESPDAEKLIEQFESAA